jgi:hypothetical protein
MAAVAIRNYKAPTSRRDRARVWLMAMAARLGLAELLPDQLRIERADVGTQGVDRDIVGYLSHVIGRDVHVCLSVGPPRAVRKPVLQIMTPDGGSVAFAKIGVDDFTRALVRSEAGTLRQLSARSWTNLRVPEVLHHGRWHGHEVIVVRAFQRQSERKLDRNVLDAAMSELARSGDVVRSPLVDSAYWQRLNARVAALNPSQYVRSIRAALGGLEITDSDHELEFGTWHGDWAPWNMRMSGTQLLVWDWEKFEADVPVGFDATHFDVQSPVVVAGVAPQDALALTRSKAVSTLARLGVPSQSARLVVTLYALDLAVRYLEDREMEAGDTRMSRLGAWLPEVVGWTEHGVDTSVP